MSIEKIEKLTLKLVKAEGLLKNISKVQGMYIQDKSTKEIFDFLLEILLESSESEYGFIGELRFREDKTPYLKTYAITDISWDDATRKFYKENAPQGLEFTNLNSLFGVTLTTHKTVISNDPSNDPRSSGRPEGHPPLSTYLGLPLIYQDTMIGMCGVANNKEGYCQEIIYFLKPLVVASTQLVLAKQKQEQNKVTGESNE